MTGDASRNLRRLQELFDQAMELPEGRRSEFIANACKSHPYRKQQLVELLAAHAAAGDALERPCHLRSGHTAELAEVPHPMPDRIGHYAVKCVIATGGMGIVYLAEQQNPVRTVAIKVLRSSFDSPSARRRFQYETECLAQLQHAGVARIFETGLCDEGGLHLPYFVMEYIDGACSITRYADEGQLNIRARLQLFVQVCEAVASGHQRGIIHRDLKPDNILVDREGQAKVIDFGVARSTDTDLTITTKRTEIGELVGTLQYMSPEQCDGDPATLDSRSDVYALGVVLYELLSGKLPYDVRRLPVPQAAKIVGEQPAPRIGGVIPALRGELETVVHKALSKSPSNRYRSAGELADDLRRYLSGEAISARRPSIAYQLRVFARRHRTLSTATGAAVLALAMGIVGTSLGLTQARYQRDEALEALAFGLDIIESVSTALAQGDRIPISVVTSAAEWVDQGVFHGQPELEAAFRTTVGRAYTSLGRHNLAEPHLWAALELETRISGLDSPEAAAVLAGLAQAVGQRSMEAETLALNALQTRRICLGAEHPNTLESMDQVSGFMMDRGAYEEAEPLIRETLETRRSLHGEDHPAVARSLQSLGYCRFASSDFSAGEPLLHRALAMQRRLLPPMHLDLAETTFILAQLCVSKRAFAEAETFLRETLAILDMRLVEDHFWSGNTRRLLASVLLDQGLVEEAEAQFRRLVEQPPAQDVSLSGKEAVARSGWGECLRRRGRFQDAEAQLLLAEELLANVHRSPMARTRWLNTERLAMLYADWGRPNQAQPYVSAAEQMLRASINEADNVFWVTLFQADLGACLTWLERFQDAEHELLNAYARFAEASGEDHPEIWRILAPIIALYETWGRPDQAAAWEARWPSGVTR